MYRFIFGFVFVCGLIWFILCIKIIDELLLFVSGVLLVNCRLGVILLMLFDFVIWWCFSVLLLNDVIEIGIFCRFFVILCVVIVILLSVWFVLVFVFFLVCFWVNVIFDCRVKLVVMVIVICDMLIVFIFVFL